MTVKVYHLFFLFELFRGVFSIDIAVDFFLLYFPLLLLGENVVTGV